MIQPVPTRSATRHLWLTTLGMAASLAAGGSALVRWPGARSASRPSPSPSAPGPGWAPGSGRCTLT